MSTKRGRRLFLSAAGGLGIMGLRGALSDQAVSTAYGMSITRKFPRVRVASVDEIRSKEPLLFSYPDAGSSCALIKLDEEAKGGVGPDGDIVAYSRACPHMGCELEVYSSPEQVLGPCSCHFSCFDLKERGFQTQGHATESLPQVVLEVVDGDVFAVGMSGLIYGRFDNLKAAP